MQQAVRAEPLSYLLYTPAGFQPGDHLPLILFLHGSGERGTDLKLVKLWGLPKLIDQRDDFPFIVLSPQCPDDTRWTEIEAHVMALLDQVVAQTGADRSRLYLTGFSMGGQGAWSLGAHYADQFAALVPVAGRMPPDFQQSLDQLAAMPTWVFHGSEDKAVPASESEIAVEALRDINPNVRLTIYAGQGHVEGCDLAYADETLSTWLLSHRLNISPS